MADSAISTSLLDPIKMKISRKYLSEQYHKEVHQSWEFNVLEEMLKGAASPRVSVHNPADGPSPNLQLKTETRTGEKTADEIKHYPHETGGLNPEFDLLLKESKIIFDTLEVNRSESLSKEAQLRLKFLIVLIKLQKQQLARQCGTAGHVKLCEALIEFERRSGTSGDPSRENVISKMAKKFFNSEAASNHENFIKRADEGPSRSDWKSIVQWMEMFEPLHENYIKISPLSKLPGFKDIYKEFKRLYRHQASAKTLQRKDSVKIWTSLKKFCSEATESLVLFFYHTETFWMTKTPHGKKENSMKEKLQGLMQRFSPDLPEGRNETASKDFRRQCYGYLNGSTTFELLTECHKIVQGLTTIKDEPTGSRETGEPECKLEDTPVRENLKKYVNNVNWDDIKKCLQCKDADMKSRVHTALTDEGDIKQHKRFILSDLDATFSSQEWEAVRLHKKAFDALEGGGGIEISVRKYLLRELDRRHLECKGKGSLSQIFGQINPVEVDLTGTCEDCKNSAHAKLSLERILDGEKLPVKDQQYLLTILDKHSSCEHCKRILGFQEVYQRILEDLPLSEEQSRLMLTKYPENNACKRCSLIGTQKMQPEKDDICKDLKETYQIHPNCKMCQDMLLCIKTYESMSQEAPLEKDTREFVSEMLKNVENQWKCEGNSTNCMETFSELCRNELSPKSRSDIIEKLNGECLSICPYCQYQMWMQTIKCVRDGAALQGEQVEFVQDIILSHACKGCCMLMEQIKVRKTLEESKVLSSNLQALLSEKIFPTTSYYKSCRQLKRCMTVLEKLNAGDILTQDDERWIKHIYDATENCQADGCSASRKEEEGTFKQNSRRAIVDIWKAGLGCESCHAKLLHISGAVHSHIDREYPNVLDEIRNHLSDEQRLECNICEGFYVPPDPLNLNHLQLKEKVSQSQMEDILGSTLRYPAVITKHPERKKASKKGSGKIKGPDRDVERMTGEKCGNQKEAATKEKDPPQESLHPLTSASGDRGCQEEDQDEDTTKGAWPSTCRSEEGEVDKGNKHSWEDTADDKSEKTASCSKSSGSTATVARETQTGGKNNCKKKGSIQTGKGRRRKLASRRPLRSGLGGPKESLASVQSKIQDQGGDEKEGQKPEFPKKRNSVDNSLGKFEEVAAIDDVVNVLLKWRKTLGIPLCLLTNYDYSSICAKKKEIASSSKGEIDIIGFLPHLGVLFVELKAVSPEGSNIKKSLRLAQEQLLKDEIFLLEVNRDWLRDGNIPVIPLIALPYVPCSILAKMGLCNLHKSRVLTKCDMDKFTLEPGNWNKFIGVPGQQLMVNGDDYCKLVERFRWKYLRKAQCSLTKGLKTVGRDMSGAFLTEDQRKLIMAEHIPYQFLAGGYGTGKSLMLVLKAKEIAKGKLNASDTSSERSIFMISCTDITVSGEKINVEQPDGSSNHLKRLMGNENHPSPSYFDHIEFCMVKDFVELTPNTEAGEDLAETLANAIELRASLLPEVHFFFDEIPFKFLESFKPHIEKLIEKRPSIRTFWFSVATHSFRADASYHQNADWVKCECPKGFNFKYLKENLRVPGNTLRLQKQFEKAMNDGHGGTERGRVPPGPKPLLYRVPLCNCQNVDQQHLIALDSKCCQDRMTATLRAMFTKLGILVSDQAVATTHCERPNNSITMLLPSVTDKSLENGLSDLLKHSCAELGIDLKDIRYKTQPGGNAANPSHVADHGEVTCQRQAQAEAPNTERHVDYPQVRSLGRTLSTESNYWLDNLENSPLPAHEGAGTSRQEPTKRPKVTLTTETGFFNCESYVIISVDLSAMMYCFRGSKVAYSTCGISRCLSQYVHLTWHFKEAKEFFKAQSELAEYLGEKKIEYALHMKPSLEKFLEEGHIVEEMVEELPEKCGKCQR